MVLSIPYNKIKNIDNMDEKKMSALRIVGLGLVFLPLAIVGAMWEKKALYTVIEYDDGFDTPHVVLDFGDNVYKYQPMIYQKVMQSRM